MLLRVPPKNEIKSFEVISESLQSDIVTMCSS